MLLKGSFILHNHCKQFDFQFPFIINPEAYMYYGYNFSRASFALLWRI